MSGERASVGTGAGNAEKRNSAEAVERGGVGKQVGARIFGGRPLCNQL